MTAIVKRSAMKPLRLILNVLPVIGILWAGAAPWPAWGAGLPKKGDTLPAFELQAPASEKAREYLGISRASFRLGDIPCRVLLLEVIGVYCPQCYRQAPLFNTLFNRIEKGKLRGQVKMLALAAGGNENEIKYLYEQVQYSFPVVPDPRFDVHKLLGEPRTLFTLLLDPEGKVLHAHMGIVEDIDAYLKLINDLVH
ncbi:MAG: TlpA family protein disulfide reductase [Hyphomicrobiales bacterium]